MAQWNPFEDLASLRQEIDRAFEGFGAGQGPIASRRLSSRNRSKTLSVD